MTRHDTSMWLTCTSCAIRLTVMRTLWRPRSRRSRWATRRRWWVPENVEDPIERQTCYPFK
jgi:hypothetical protein